MRIALVRAESANSNDPRVGTLRPSFQRDLAFDATRVDQSRRSATVGWMRCHPPTNARQAFAGNPSRPWKTLPDFCRDGDAPCGHPGAGREGGMTGPQRGMTLVELVMTIVIIGIAAAAMFAAMASITGRSADPMLRQQSLMIAGAYLEALQSLPYEELLDSHDLVQKGGAPEDLAGLPITGLGNYVVDSEVIGDTLNGVDAKRIDVTVTDPAGQRLTLTGYRADY